MLKGIEGISRPFLWGAIFSKLKYWIRHPQMLLFKLKYRLGKRRLRTYRELLAASTLSEPPQTSISNSVKFSVVMPVHVVKPELLAEAISSVLQQSHQLLELVVVMDGPLEAALRRVVERAKKEDPRVKVEELSSRTGIARATLRGLEAATGEWIVFFDHDDMLHPHALAHLSRHLLSNPKAEWVFTDEDKVDEAGNHFDPLLKPGFSRHMLLSFNYVCHMRALSRKLLDSIGGPDPRYDPVHDYELALRAAFSGARFSHLGSVLYHWRWRAGSMAVGAHAKQEANKAALKALRDVVSHHVGEDAQFECRELLPPSSVFRVEVKAKGDLTKSQLEVLNSKGGTWEELWDACAAEDPGRYWREVVEAARRSRARYVAILPKAKAVPADEADLEGLRFLVGALMLGNTVAASGRLIKGHRVAGSGWWAGADGKLKDPWRGLHVADPGYMNTALMPGPRLLPPPYGWVADRQLLMDAWEAGDVVEDAVRLGAGAALLGAEVVALPYVEFRVAGVPRDLAAYPVPQKVPFSVHEPIWARCLGLS